MMWDAKRREKMTKQEQIDAYRAQISEMQKKIRELKVDGIVDTGKARIAPKKSFTYEEEERWALAYSVRLQSYSGRNGGEQYHTLFVGTRNECIDAIPGIIADLKDLMEAVNGQNNAG